MRHPMALSRLSQGSVMTRHLMALRQVHAMGMQKVRELDTAQSRIHDTLQRINLTVDRSSAVDGIK